MKTIIENSTKLSKYLLKDSDTVTMLSESIAVGDPIRFFIGDLNNSNATLHTNVNNAPEDWVGNKYTYHDSTWTVDSDWVNPEE